jgi:hypothetical protein
MRQLTLTVQDANDSDVELVIEFRADLQTEIYEIGERKVTMNHWGFELLSITAYVAGESYQPTNKERFGWIDKIETAISEELS